MFPLSQLGGTGSKAVAWLIITDLCTSSLVFGTEEENGEILYKIQELQTQRIFPVIRRRNYNILLPKLNAPRTNNSKI